MRKKLDFIFIILCAVICLIPVFGMIFAPTMSTTEKRSLATWPQFVEEGKLNSDYLSDMGRYFEDHFFLKNQMVAADSKIIGTAFNTSSVATVVKGTDDWLYYASTLDDYLGRNVLTEEEAYKLVHNISLVQASAKEAGAEFVFTIAPNKNSLYPDNMPYYYKKARETNNYDLVSKELERQEIAYVNLYDAFKNEPEVLYRKQDSHWNQKGAVFAYNLILDYLGKNHMDYSGVEITKSRSQVGDLANALYSVAATPDWDYKYNYEPEFSFVTDTTSWEEDFIATRNDQKLGQLLMFRDSFGNTLSPLLADEFKEASFSKDTVYFWDERISQAKPNYVIVEIVERNISNFLNNPPIMQGPVALDFQGDFIQEENSTDLDITESKYDSNYYVLSGNVDEKYINDLEKVYVQVEGKNSTVYEAYLTEKGYMLYLKNNSFQEASLIKIYGKIGENSILLFETNLTE